jgi:two-component system NarL family sensor kinase
MENQTGIAIFIAIGCLTMLCLAMGVLIFLNIHRKKMLEKEAKIQAIEHEKHIEVFKAATEAEENQKEKIAKNLHDGVVAPLSAVSRSIDKNIKDYENNKFSINRMRKDIRTIEQTIEIIRGISHDLAPSDLFSFGLIKALGYHLDTIRELADSNADFENRTAFNETVPFTKTDQLNIFRICLEIINNLLKHAKYKYLKVIVESDNKYLLIEFMYDGKGITNDEVRLISESSTGLGLNSIISRSLMLNASIDYSIEEEISFVRLKIPFKI